MTSQEDVKLESSTVRLRPIVPSDYAELFHYETSERLIARWRHRGQTPNPENYALTLWPGILAQFIVEDVSTKLTVGIVACHDADFQNGHAQVAVARFTTNSTAVFLKGASLFVDYIFSCWDLSKLYLEVPEFNLDQISSRTVDLFHEEGRFKDHLFRFGRRWDLIFLAIYRDQWNASPITEAMRSSG